MKGINIVSISIALFLCQMFSSDIASAQQADTINIISYNLDDFRNGPTFAARASAQIDALSNLRPNIIICQGINDSIGAIAAWPLLQRNDGRSKSEYYGYGHSLLLFDSTQVQLLDQNVIPTGRFPIDEWVMYALMSSDTFIIISCQFVEGEDAVAVAERAVQAQSLRAHLHQRRTQKIVVAGTLNFYSSTESGFRWLTEDVPFGDTLLRNPVRDPIDSAGVWHRNSMFARWHTYNTQLDTSLDTSGLVDRFDYVLVSSDILTNNLRRNTYSVFGNNGNRFGRSVTNNGTVITSSTSGLEKGSRHLPLYFHLIFRKATTGVERTEDIPRTMDLSENHHGMHQSDDHQQPFGIPPLPVTQSTSQP